MGPKKRRLLPRILEWNGISGKFASYGYRGRGRGSGRGSAYAGPLRKQNQPQKASQSTGASQPVQEEKKSRAIYPAGYQGLMELLDKNAREVTLTIQEEGFGFHELLKSKSIDPEFIMVILELLAEVAQCNTCPQNQFALLDSTMSSKLYTTLIPGYIASALEDPLERLHLSQMLTLFMVLCRKLLLTFPNRASNELGIAFVACKDIMERNMELSLDIDSETWTDFLELDDIRIKLLDKLDSSTCDKHMQDETSLALATPEDFRSMAVTPTHEDIHGVSSPCPTRWVSRKRKHANIERYLDFLFRLLKEDYIAPLREGLANYMVYKRDNIYHDVRISMPEYTTYNGITYILNFNVKKLRRVNWEVTTRLLVGSLVCLSSNSFQTFLLAIVVKRDVKLLKVGFFNVRFILDEGREAWDLHHDEIFTMIESPMYYEAYSPILKGLQSIKEETLPFRKYMVDSAANLAAPKYMQHKRYLLISPLLKQEIRETKYPVCQVLSDATWPTAEEVCLDVEQYCALKTALTKEVAIIQGPPGTGKTFLCLKITEVLLSNVEEWFPTNWPILVICYSDHGLDQFLEGVLKFAPNSIVRVGGQSTCLALDPFTLNSMRRTMNSEKQLPNYLHFSRVRLCLQMHQIQNDISKIADVVNICKSKILHVKILEEFGDPKHFSRLQQLHKSSEQGPTSAVSGILVWLGLLNDVFEDETIEAGKSDSKAGANKVQYEYEAEYEFEEEEQEEDVLVIEEMQRRIVDDYGFDDHLKWTAKAMWADDQFKQVVAASHIAPMNVEARTDEWISLNLQKMDMMNDEEAGRIPDVADLSYSDRWRLYRYWVSKLRAKRAEEMWTLQLEYQKCYKRLQEVIKEIDIAILQEARVIGITITAVAKYRDVLQIVAPKIVIVEEAAEVLESRIITALTKDCQHIILIGDHQQLRTNPNVHKLAKDYLMDISLFERLIKNGVPYERLNLQHRMRPRIAALLKLHSYPDLQNAKSVEEYEEVRGVDASMFFINHSHHEAIVQDSTSYTNEFEAEFLVALCCYLLLQGYESSQITILATYLGQLLLIKRLTRNTEVSNVRCTVVDNYQGEENDIVLLSLVRSNVDEKVGFLAAENRICVALSRAKKGLYCIGNFDFLEENADKWKPIVASMRQDGLIASQLTLRCQNHPHTATQVAMARDFDLVPEGGCQLPCDFRLPCGHLCPKVCHTYDKEHLKIICKRKCEKHICKSGHQCPKKCPETCDKCNVLVSRTLRCGHDKLLQCHRNPRKAKCRQPCNKMLSCGHLCKKKCGDACTLMNCTAKLVQRTSCEHTLSVPCSTKNFDQFLLQPCKVACGEMLPCGHYCSGDCSLCKRGRMHLRCKEKCGRTLLCAHVCLFPCAKGCPPCLQPCENLCVHSKCPNRCGFPCPACMKPCAWKCPHYACTKRCHELCDRPPCNQPCLKVLECGHYCIGLCGEPCPPLCRRCDREAVCEIFFGNEDEEDTRFVFLEDCRHVIEVHALDTWMQDGTEGHASIGMKACPKCKTIVKHNLRYGNIIKKILADVAVIKKNLFGRISRMMMDCESLKKEAAALAAKRNFPLVTCLSQMASELFSFGTVGRSEVVALQSKFHFLNVMYKLWKTSPKYVQPGKYGDRLRQRLVEGLEAQQLAPQELRAAVEKILKPVAHNRKTWITVNGKLKELTVWHRQLNPSSSSKEIYDFSRQLKRVSHLSAFLLNTKGRTMNADAQACYDGIHALLIGTRPFSELVEDQAASEMVRLKALMSAMGIGEAEKIEMENAIGLSQGHWYKCPYGHIYAVADCVGVVQGICPDCSSVVEGQRDQLGDGNPVAVEIDVATQSTCPDASDD